MKLTITHYLVALAMLAILFACLMASYLKHGQKKESYRSQVRARVRSFNRIEKFMLAFVLGMRTFSSWFHLPDGSNRIVLANLLATPPIETDTKICDVPIVRYLVLKPGSDADHVAVCGANDIPHAFNTESNGGTGDRISFFYLGIARRGTIGTASGAIVAGNLVCPGANGTLRDVTLVVTQTVYICGIAVTGAADGKPFTWIPYAPVQRVIA